MSRIDETRPFLPVNIAILTVSDTRGVAEDKSGQTLIDPVTKDGHRVAARVIARHEIAERGIAALEVVVPFGVGDVGRLPRVAALDRHPDPPVVAK